MSILFCSTTWGSQPYTRGAYTAIAVGACQDDIDNVAQPLYSNDQQAKVRYFKNSDLIFYPNCLTVNIIVWN